MPNKVKKSALVSEPANTENSDKMINNNCSQIKVPFSVVEAYKNIRTNLMSMLAKTDSKVISFSSPNAAEGKSTTSVNVAIALSQLNKKILLIDADARRPSIHKKLKLDNEAGCIDVISGNASFEDAIINYNPFMDILTAGTSSSNPSELFSSTGFDYLLENVKEKYDFVIVDTPPINLVSDSLVIAQKCDGLILIIRAGVTTHDSFNRTLASVDVLNINLTGVVMNGSSSNVKKYYKYKAYKY